MGLIILHKLAAKLRTIVCDGYCMEVQTSAFIGATDGEICEFGIGLIDENGKSLFWALVCPHMLMTAWRGMQILDKTTSILHGTIHHAYCAGGDDDNDRDVQTGITELQKQIPEIAKLRQEILKTPIDDATLNEMLKICNDPHNSINIFTGELKKAVEAGIIRQTEEVSRAYKIAVEEEVQRKRDEDISKQPLPEHKSFLAFCKHTGIRHLFSNPYDDWPTYWDVKRVDENLVYEGLRCQSSEEIWCAKNPSSFGSTGHVGHPVLELNDNRTITLLQVRFIDNDMQVAFHPTKSPDALEWNTLSQLLAFEPQFVGLTFSGNDQFKPEDITRGYIAIRSSKNPIKKIAQAINT